MAIGSSAPWTDHEKSVWARVSATISSLVIEPRAVVVSIDHLVAGAVAGPAFVGRVGRRRIGRRRCTARGVGRVAGPHYSTTQFCGRCRLGSAEPAPDLAEIVEDEQQPET